MHTRPAYNSSQDLKQHRLLDIEKTKCAYNNHEDGLCQRTKSRISS